MPTPSLIAQTTYAELLERCAAAAFTDAFSEPGGFVSKTSKGRRYWYFQTGTGEGRSQRFVGPETPELLEHIQRHRVARGDERQRRALVSALVRSFGLPRPIPQIGDIVDALAKAGVFRLRGVLVGTIAYQTYSAMLGVKLSPSLLQTGDVDVAQFQDASIAIGDNTRPILEVLRDVDKTFRVIPNPTDSRRATSYTGKDGFRVDFLTPARGPDRDKPQPLPSFKTEAQPLPFLDYLIHEPEPAVILHNSGVYVHVPVPQRYAVHKLIVSRRRAEGSAKRDKDIRQAEALLQVLAETRPYDLKLAWQEAQGRGSKWRRLLGEGVGQVRAGTRDLVVKVVDGRRSMIPGLDLTFGNPPAHYDPMRDVVTFMGQALGSPVVCAISREALDDHFDADGPSQKKRVESFLRNRSKIELMARTKYLSWPIDEPGALLVKTMDVPMLLKEIRAKGSPLSRSAGE